MIRVRSVEVLEGFQVKLGFSDGTEKVVDMEPYLTGPIFDSIRCKPELWHAVFVDEELGTIVWPNGADLCPDVLYHGRIPASHESTGV